MIAEVPHEERVNALLEAGNVDFGKVQPHEMEHVQASMRRYLISQRREFIEWAKDTQMRFIPIHQEDDSPSALKYVIEEMRSRAVRLNGIFFTDKAGWYVAPLPGNFIAAPTEGANEE